MHSTQHQNKRLGETVHALQRELRTFEPNREAAGERERLRTGVKLHYIQSTNVH